jgi:hypothetical protein
LKPAWSYPLRRKIVRTVQNCCRGWCTNFDFIVQVCFRDRHQIRTSSSSSEVVTKIYCRQPNLQYLGPCSRWPQASFCDLGNSCEWHLRRSCFAYDCILV